MPAAGSGDVGACAARADPAGQGGAIFEKDALVWVPDCSVVWAPGRVTNHTATELAVTIEDADESRVLMIRRNPVGKAPLVATSLGRQQAQAAQLVAQQLLRRNVALVGEGALGFNDLTEVPELHEAAVLHALDVRFARGVIYTSTGPVLLSVNPFRTLPGLYGPEALRRYVHEKDEKRLLPHIFGIARRMFQAIREIGTSQTVLISGESGAGKTEATKFVMQFLALAGAEEAVITANGFESAGPSTGAGSSKMSRIERQVLESNPLLESFGNAKTLRNENSSRFGKYIELQFGSRGDTELLGFGATPRLGGARVRTYLLEKVRVTAQQDGERSFHIFYQAIAAAASQSIAGASRSGNVGSHSLKHHGNTWSPGSPDPDMGPSNWGRSTSGDAMSPNLLDEGGACDLDLSAFVGRSAAAFSYLRRSAGVRLTHGDDVEEFEATLCAMRTIGLGTSEASEVFRALGAVLHLGELEFAASDNNSEGSQFAGDCYANQEIPSAVTMTSDLLGLAELDLQSALCTRSMQAPEGIIRMTNTVPKAVESRDALARHLYNAIFRHIVTRTNSSIGFIEDARFCGVLDIFGFEYFEINSFEQLCINFTNELLQQYFNAFIFENEASLYKEEGITWEPLDFPDNAAIVELLQSRPHGVLPMLDEECFAIGGSSESWHQKLVRQHEKHPRFNDVKIVQATFRIDHFAGPVTYTAQGFLEKNQDRLSQDVLQCLRKSARPFICERFLEYDRTFGTQCSTGQDAASVAQNAQNDVSSGWFGRKKVSDGLSRVVKAQRWTVSSEFRLQLHELMTQIRTTHPHFVRCIKPNAKCQAYENPAAPSPKPLLERISVAEQLSYQGVLEAIRVARAGFPVRFTHALFLSDFLCLASPELRQRLQSVVTKAGEASIVEVKAFLECPMVRSLMPDASTSGSSASCPEGWSIGKTKVFMKQAPYSALKLAQSQRRYTAAALVQAVHHGRKAREVAHLRRKGILALQTLCRTRAARKQAGVRRRQQAVVTMQASCRTLLLQHRLSRVRLVAQATQSWVRMRPCRARFLLASSQVQRLQRWWRMCVWRRRWRQMAQDILRLQSMWRGFGGRRVARDRLVALFRLKCACRRLVRRRRAAGEQRLWRKRMMELYHRKPVQQRQQSEKDRHSLVTEYIELEREHAMKKLDVIRLRAEYRNLRQRVAENADMQFPSLGF